MAKSLPRISVVVATRNRLSSLKRCIESLCVQDYPKGHMELIIVNDGSTDDTPHYLVTLAAQEPWVKVVNQARGWQASARNTGIEIASGELIAITDDDCTVTEDWLLSMATAMQDQTIAGIAGHVQAPGSNLIARYLDHVRSLDPPLLPNGLPQMLITANACFRRSVLDRVGCFDETFGAVGAEDTELSLRMRRRGMRLKFVPASSVAHWFEPDITLFLRRFYRYGLGVRHVFDKHLAWEYWFPRADTRLQTLFNEISSGNVQVREFHEVEEPHLRPWYSLLAVLQRLSFLAGYLSVRSREQLLSLQQSGNSGQYQESNDRIPLAPSEARGKQAKAILQALSIDQLPASKPERGQEEHEVWFDRNVFPPPESGKLGIWVSTLLNIIGIDSLLELAASYYLPHSEPGVPDASLSAFTRTIYTFRHKRNKGAYARQHTYLLRQLTRQSDSVPLATIEALCYANSICVNRFLSWYGDILSDSCS